MKKFILIVICFFICSGLIICYYYSTNSLETFDQQIVTISKILIQSICTGTVTFLGLFFTIYSQEIQNREKLRVELCPCFIVKLNGMPSAAKEYNDNFSNNMVICCNSRKVREVKCDIINCRNNFGLNVAIYKDNLKKYIGSLNGNEKLSITLILDSDNENSFFINFEDVYGIRYFQKIDYNFIGNRYNFISHQPTRSQNR